MPFVNSQNGINYKALIKDDNGTVLASSPISIQFTIYEGAALTNNVYQESHTINTDANGFVIVNIGEGPTGDDFNAINWSTDEHYLNVKINTGSGLVDLGTTQFMAVPYALNALTSNDNYWTNNANGISTQNNAVGINSTNPEHTLDVRSVSLADPSGLNISNSDKSRFLRFFSGSDMFPDPSITLAPDRNLLFASFDDNTFTFNEYMRISSLGNVGIGSVDPQAKLDVLGGDWDLEAGNPGDLKIGSAADSFKIGVATSGVEAGTTKMYTTSNDLIIGTNNVPRMTITADGKIGLGNVFEPTEQLHLIGAIRIADISLRSFGNQLSIRYNNVDMLGFFEGSSEWGPQLNNSIRLGRSAFRYSEIWSINPLNTTSDKRLKKEIKPINYGLSQVMKLKPVSYKWKQGNQDTKLGFIAQDVTSVVPEIVKFEETTPEIRKQIIESGREVPKVDYYAMSYTELIPVLTKAIQEQQTIINNQNAKIESIEIKLNALLEQNNKTSNK